ncbi:hypothetical protein HY312_01115 [Candidatus Saccharibacteria bacterium]|nr:hypothetical protein [Candidatus Saccharibacteria bacterium]
MVTLTIDGRTYMISTRILDPEIKAGRKPRSRAWLDSNEDYVDSKEARVVPNGKWIMNMSGFYTKWLVGINHSELETVSLDTTRGADNMLFISDKPFGFVTADKAVRPPGCLHVEPVGRRILLHSRQIHKGELGQSIPIPRPEYVRACDKSRGNGWVRLESLAEVAGLAKTIDAIELVTDYWNFSGHRDYLSSRGDNLVTQQRVDVVEATDDDEIKGKNPEVFATNQGGFKIRTRRNPGAVWIRRGFAFTILRLTALGVRPETFQSA